MYTRPLAEEVQNALHQPFVLENRPGAGTTIGGDPVAKAAPDGYTLRAWERQGATPFTMAAPPFANYLAAQVAKWAKVIKANHITLINESIANDC